MKPVSKLLFLAVSHLLLVTWLEPASANNLNRDSDPVVMKGSELPSLVGLPPGAIVAFRHESGWVQIPVQVDERAVRDYGEVYNSLPVGFSELVYTDAGTFVGPDPDPLFDSDDELVFMAKDAGDLRAFGSDPVGVVPGSRIEVVIADPLTSQRGWIYLFESAGGLSPGAGVDYVSYNFNLLAGPYLTSYNTVGGPNPEDSEAVTAYYSMHFSDRWIRDVGGG